MQLNDSQNSIDDASNEMAGKITIAALESLKRRKPLAKRKVKPKKMV